MFEAERDAIVARKMSLLEGFWDRSKFIEQKIVVARDLGFDDLADSMTRVIEEERASLNQKKAEMTALIEEARVEAERVARLILEKCIHDHGAVFSKVYETDEMVGFVGEFLCSTGWFDCAYYQSESKMANCRYICRDLHVRLLSRKVRSHAPA